MQDGWGSTDARERPFAPRQTHSAGLLLAGLACAAALAVAWAWWSVDHPPRPVPVPAGKPAPAPQREARPAPPPAPGAIVRCVRNGRTTYTDGACEPGASAQAVDIDLERNLAQRLRVPAAEADNEPPEPPAQVRHTARTNPAAAPNKALCASLASAVDANDAAARRPQSGPMQDRLREEKRRLRDVQAANRC